MQVGVLTTNGGPHPADKWARMSAWMLVNQLIRIDENAASPNAAALREARDELERKVYGVLKEHHAKVQAGERDKIAVLGPARLSAPLHDAVGEHVDVDGVVAAVVAAAQIHPDLFAHYSKDATKVEVKALLVRDFASVMDIERDWHANGYFVGNDGRAAENPNYDRRDPHVQAHKARRAPA